MLVRTYDSSDNLCNIRTLAKILSLFSGTFVCEEKQMTVGWRRNVIISFLSSSYRGSSEEDRGHCRGSPAFVLQCTAILLRRTPHIVNFASLCSNPLQYTGCH